MCVLRGAGGGNGYMYMCDRVPSLFIWNYHNIVNWLYPNTKWFWCLKKKKSRLQLKGIRRASHLPSRISEAEFKATAGGIISWRDSPFPAHLSQWKRGRTPFPLPRQEVHKGREGLLLKEATASEVVALTTGFGVRQDCFLSYAYFLF